MEKFAQCATLNYCNYFERSLIEKEKAAAQSVPMPSRVRSIKLYQSIIAAINGTFSDLQACNCIIRYFFLDDDLLLLYLSSKVNVGSVQPLENGFTGTSA